MARNRRTVLLFALLTALVAGGWNACTPEVPVPEQSLLDYVPSDTVFFAGRTQAALASELSRVGDSGIYHYLLGLAGGDPRRAATDFGPAAGILMALLQAQRGALQRGDRAFAVHGIPHDGVLAAYTVGQTPVLRWELADARTFWRGLDAAERAAGVETSERGRDSLRLRRYPFRLGEFSLELVFATGDGFALATLHAPRGDGTTLDEALGLDKPADSLDRITLDNLALAYGLAPGTIAFLNNDRLLAPLTDPDIDGTVERIARWVAAAGAARHPLLESLGTTACREALAVLPDFWMRTVTGVTGFDPDTGRIEQRLVFESDHQRGLARIESVKGHMPAIVSAPQTVLGIGLAVDFTTWMSPPPDPDHDRKQEAPDETAPAPPAGISGCPALAAIQRSAAGGGGAPGPVGRLLPRIRGFGAAVFRTPPADGPGGRRGAASALMIATDDPRSAQEALQTTLGLQASGRPPMDQPYAAPWRFARTIVSAAGPGEIGLLLSSTVPVLAQPVDADEDEAPAGSEAIAAFRYRHGAPMQATVSAVEPWLEPLRPGQREVARKSLRRLHALPFDLALDLRVGTTGIELDVAVTPTAPWGSQLGDSSGGP